MGSNKVYWLTSQSGPRWIMAFMTAGCAAHTQYKSIRGVTWLCDDPLPDIKSRVVMDGRMYRKKSPK